jgi:hypothetical protein
MTTPAEELRQRLLADKYGNWFRMERSLLESMCDRMVVELDDLYRARNEEELANLRDEYDALAVELNKAEERVVELQLDNRVNELRP